MSYSTLYSPLEIRRRIADRARSLRLFRKKTQAELAAAAGVGLSTISRFERGEDVAFGVVINVALALGAEESLLGAFPEQDIRSFDELIKRKPTAKRIRRRKT